MIQVYIVEDDHDIRTNLALIIGQTSGFECVGMAPDAETALEEIVVFCPDVVLMDVSLPGMSGIDCLKCLKQTMPDLDIIMLTIHDDDDTVFKSLCMGACGYLTKNTKPEKLIAAIREAHAGGAPMTTNIARMVVSSFHRHPAKSLTGRENEVLNLLCNGKSYKMIADKLFISHDTVRSHIKSIYRKLQVNSKSEAVAKAFKDKLV